MTFPWSKHSGRWTKRPSRVNTLGGRSVSPRSPPAWLIIIVTMSIMVDVMKMKISMVEMRMKRDLTLHSFQFFLPLSLGCSTAHLPSLHFHINLCLLVKSSLICGQRNFEFRPKSSTMMRTMWGLFSLTTGNKKVARSGRADFIFESKPKSSSCLFKDSLEKSSSNLSRIHQIHTFCGLTLWLSHSSDQ